MYRGTEPLEATTGACEVLRRQDQRSQRARIDDREAIRLVLSPGISLDYESVPGWSKAVEDKMPHGWIAGVQTEILRQQLDAVPNGGLIVVIPPPNPSRCPPGPYERVSMMAHALKSSGRSNARIVIVDPKDKFSKQALFQQGWEKHYPSMIEWMPPMIHAGINSVDAANMTVVTGFEAYCNANLINGSVGFKLNVYGNVLLTANGLFPLSDNGLTDDFSGLIGIDYSF